MGLFGKKKDKSSKVENQILQETPLTKLVKEKAKPKRTF